MLFARLLSTRSALPVFVTAIFAVYCALPAILNAAVEEREYFAQLASLALVGSISLCVGYGLPLTDSRFATSARRISISATGFHGVVWVAFIVFLLVTVGTAADIPLLSALKGASVAELDQQRGAFLKGREGAAAILPYLSTLFLSALLPYSLVHLFVAKSRLRYVLTFVFLAFSISFLVKALFVNVAFPLLYYASLRKKSSMAGISVIAAGSLLLLYFLTKFAVGDALSVDAAAAEFDAARFFTMSYVASSPLEFIVWRSVAVPMLTAADTLQVHAEMFGGDFLFGATSSLFASLFGMERIPLERWVFAHQFGWNDIANANAVFLTETFVNFGWMGTVLLAMFAGQTLRWFEKSTDPGFKSLWILYCFSLFSSGLIGTMLSNGYVVIFFLALFCKLRLGTVTRAVAKTGPSARAPAVAESV